MYLVSTYFDERTNQILQQHINKIAEETGNTFMLDENIPPHITISAFETTDEKIALDALARVTTRLKRGSLEWVSVGQFFPYVIFLSPVLNEYLHEISVQVYEELASTDSIRISPYYHPFHWFPHSTIGKKLSKEEMKVAFEILQNRFSVFEGEVVRIGLSKPNPHRDIANWMLIPL